MSNKNLLQAINAALDTAMQVDERVLCFGEDVGAFGGVFRATSHLQEKFGKSRCFNTPPDRTGHRRFCQWSGCPGPKAGSGNPVC